MLIVQVVVESLVMDSVRFKLQVDARLVVTTRYQMLTELDVTSLHVDTARLPIGKELA